MPVSMNNTQVVFNDSTTQTTAPVNTNANIVAIGVTSPIASSGGTSPTISHANSGVTAASYTNANITVNAQGHITAASNGSGGAGTVTSVATGNGLQGGTITTSGTLSIACPGGNTVGSWVYGTLGIQTQSLSYGSTNFSPGGNTNQFAIAYSGDAFPGINTLPISGTWRYFGATQPSPGGGYNGGSALFCRVS